MSRIRDIGLSYDIVTIGAVQMQMELVRSGKHYAKKVFELTEKAVEQGAQLVIFPEYSATPLLGLIPGIEKILKGHDISSAVSQFAGDDAMVADIFRAIAPDAKSIYVTTYSQIAKCFGIYVVAGSIFLPDGDGKVYNQCYVFGSDGEIVGIQKKLHLFQIESQWGLCPGTEHVVFDTRVGKIGITVCMDVTYFEPCRILASEGVELLVMPAANPEVYRRWEQLRGLWARVQENCLYGVQCCMVGNFAGLHIQGLTSFYAPLDLTDDRSGILKTAETPDKEEVVVFSLDYTKLRELREKQNPFAKLNYELIGSSLLQAYDIYLRKSAGGGRSVL
ncbi:MAG: nitrilase [Actinobacteria bacterium]|nr:nitrilase [Actinomycetota bacterium]